VSFRNLGSFVQALRARGELVEVEAEVDPHLELAEIHRRVIQANGPALLFKRVKGKRFPVVTNLFGTRSRVDLAFGDLPKSLVRRVAKLPEELLPPSPARLWRQRDLARPLLKVGFKRQSRAPVMAEQIPGADLTQLPAVTSWELDGGPFVTLPLVHTKVPDDLARGLPDNLGMYRLQIHDAKETGLHFQIGKGGGFHLEACERAGRSLPVNV
jgi:UbiD family decarboxylase